MSLICRSPVEQASEPSSYLQLVVDAINFPTSLTFDDAGALYIAESGLPFGGAPAGGRIWRIDDDGSRTVLLDGLRAPVNGLTHHRGWFYISEGGSRSRITRWRPGATPAIVVGDMPGPGNYHTNMTVVGPDDKLYFSQGAMTNSGIVGLDAYELGWLRRLPHAHDVPGYDITLAGVNVETRDPLRGDGSRTTTGAFSPFGTPSPAGRRRRGQLPCTAAVMRCNLDGTELELVAWGLRNAYGLGFLGDGRLLATDQGADDRGSRPIGNAPDQLYEVKRRAWYGWPDFIGGVPVTDASFTPERGGRPTFVLANHHELPAPERPLLTFPQHCGAVKFGVVPAHAPLYGGQLITALFGDERPMVAPRGPRAGRALARIDLMDWTLHPLIDRPLRRPIDVAFHPVDGALHVLDFGAFEMGDDAAVMAEAATGRIWRLPLDRL